MMTPICPRFLNMINDFVLLRFRARPPRGFKRYRSYIFIIIVIIILQVQLCGVLDYVTQVWNTQTSYARRRSREGFAGDVACFEWTDSRRKCLQRLVEAEESSVCGGKTKTNRKRRATG